MQSGIKKRQKKKSILIRNKVTLFQTLIQYWSYEEIFSSIVFLVNCTFVKISLCFAIYKNIVHSLEPGETPSKSASHQVPHYVQHS